MPAISEQTRTISNASRKVSGHLMKSVPISFTAGRARRLRWGTARPLSRASTSPGGRCSSCCVRVRPAIGSYLRTHASELWPRGRRTGPAPKLPLLPTGCRIRSATKPAATRPASRPAGPAGPGQRCPILEDCSLARIAATRSRDRSSPRVLWIWDCVLVAHGLTQGPLHWSVLFLTTRQR